MKVVGNLIYYRYINPAIVAPESFDVMESLISPSQRKNLAEVNFSKNNFRSQKY